MRQFSAARYIKRFKWLIFALAVAGALGVFVYAVKRQTYTASMVIRYSGGYVPEDKREIYSPNIIDSALMELDNDSNIDTIRSRFYVEPVIDEDDQTMIAAQLGRGQIPDYVEDTYCISYTDERRDSARNILDAVIKHYYDSFTEQFTEEQIPENGVAGTFLNDNDYLDCAEVLETNLTDMLKFLSRKVEAQPDLRSIHTCCSYQDLYEAFNCIYRHDLPLLYTEILATAEAKDRDVLSTRLRKEISDYYTKLNHLEKQIDLLNNLIESFTQQTEIIDEYHRDENADGTTGNVLDEMQRFSGSRPDTTYDSLMSQYVELRTEYECTKIDIDHKSFLLSTFNGGQNPFASQTKTENMSDDFVSVAEPVTEERIANHIDEIVAMYNEYYAVADRTCSELNGVLSASYLTTVSSISVKESINLPRYVTIALLFFLIFGIGISIVLGRGIELAEGMLYIEKGLDLPNRARCDMYIEENSEKFLPENYACIVWNVALGKISERYGRNVGDTVLKDFAKILKNFEELYGFIAYNGGGQFFAFFEDCSERKLEAINRTMTLETENYNKVKGSEMMIYSTGSVITTEAGVYQLRPLIRLAVQRQRGTGSAPVEENAKNDAVGNGNK